MASRNERLDSSRLLSTWRFARNLSIVGRFRRRCGFHSAVCTHIHTHIRHVFFPTQVFPAVLYMCLVHTRPLHSAVPGMDACVRPSCSRKVKSHTPNRLLIVTPDAQNSSLVVVNIGNDDKRDRNWSGACQRLAIGVGVVQGDSSLVAVEDISQCLLGA